MVTQDQFPDTNEDAAAENSEPGKAAKSKAEKVPKAPKHPKDEESAELSAFEQRIADAKQKCRHGHVVVCLGQKIQTIPESQWRHKTKSFQKKGYKLA